MAAERVEEEAEPVEAADDALVVWGAGNHTEMLFQRCDAFRAAERLESSWSSASSRNARRPRWTRDFTVPTAQPSDSAASS